MDATGDHLLLLQTDIPYMRRQIKLVNECQVIKGAPREMAHILIMQDFLRDIEVHLYWKRVFDEFEHLKRCYIRFRDHIHPGERLPKKYDKALGALELLLVNAMHSFSAHPQAIIPQRPGFRRHWNFKEDPENEQMKISRKGDTLTDLFQKDLLEWCLMQLQGPPDDQKRFDHALLFAFLDEHISTCKASDRARLDETLYEKLSDYAAIHELLVAARLHRPQNTNRDTDDDQLELATALKAFCEVPLPAGRKDHAWLQRSDGVRKALEAFWTNMSRCWHRSLEEAGYSADEIRSELDFFSVYDSSGYLQDVQAARAEILASIGSVMGTEIKMSRLQSWQAEELAKTYTQEVKAKVKTRPDQAVTALQLEGDVDAMTAEEPEPKIAVSRRAFDVFSHTFPASGAEAAAGVEWDLFVHAMADVGFSARNSGGSAVVFEKKNDADVSQTGKIVFHRPHPVSKTDPVMLHSMGKRMRKWFGWHRGLFAL
ncbi:hypothetical protein V2W45_1504379 [Cenococcum geophilum]